MSKVNISTDPSSLGSVTLENFFLSTKATFLECDQPQKIPDYISEGESCYWHGSDEIGSFVIRHSDHWCQYYVDGTQKVKRFRSRIRSCCWNIIIQDDSFNTELNRTAKCYLKDFERIIWKTKRRYEII